MTKLAAVSVSGIDYTKIGFQFSDFDINVNDHQQNFSENRPQITFGVNQLT